MKLSDIIRNKPIFEIFSEAELIQLSKIEFSTQRFMKGELHDMESASTFSLPGGAPSLD